MRITDIGSEVDNALICRHGISDVVGLGDWYYNGTDETRRVQDTDEYLGWRVWRDQQMGTVNLRSFPGGVQRGYTVEGTFSCVVDGVAVSLPLYYERKLTSYCIYTSKVKLKIL